MATTVRIGHASIDENNKASGGSAGDQTGKEVYIADAYDVTKKGYTILLRPISAEIAEKSAKACEAGCLNDCVGYDQNQRTTLYTQALAANWDLSKITTNCECDCSSFMAVCALAAGVDVPYSVTTQTMTNHFVNSGCYEKKTDSIYFNSSDYLKRGDILVLPGKHTIMILGNGTNISVNDTTETLLTDLAVIKITVNMDEINTTSIKATANLTVLKDGVESPISDAGIYKWRYTVESLDGADIHRTNELKPNTSSVTFSVSGLSTGNVYGLKLSAAEHNGTAEFNSAIIVFTTAESVAINNTSIKFDQADKVKNFKIINNFYIKIADSFKYAIAHLNT